MTLSARIQHLKLILEADAANDARELPATSVDLRGSQA